jgi:hypothetical protein
LWAISDNEILVSCHEIVPAGNWSPWSDWKKTPEDSRWIEVTACKQGDGKGALWAIDTKQQLWGMGQASPGGDWGGWSGPNWLKAQKVSNIAAVEEGGQKGACLWALTSDYRRSLLSRNRRAVITGPGQPEIRCSQCRLLK